MLPECSGISFKDSAWTIIQTLISTTSTTILSIKENTTQCVCQQCTGTHLPQLVPSEMQLGVYSGNAQTSYHEFFLCESWDTMLLRALPKNMVLHM